MHSKQISISLNLKNSGITLFMLQHKATHSLDSTNNNVLAVIYKCVA